MVYEYNPDMLPDACFHPGSLKYIVPGNEGRMLDGRRTPVRVLEIKEASGFFLLEVLDFEDKGALWEIPFENVERFQFAKGSAQADSTEIETYNGIIARLDQPLRIPADPQDRKSTETRITALRRQVGTWLGSKSHFLASEASLDFSTRTGNPDLWFDLKRYMTEQGLWDIEEAFADQFVSNPNSGELVKGHCIVMAELGLVPFDGKRVRDLNLFGGVWSKQRRADHILHRLSFLRALFEELGHSTIILYRGFSCVGKPDDRKNESLISTTFNLAVAESHFTGREHLTTGVLYRQEVFIERVFMTYLETIQMNKQFKEAEAILFVDRNNKLF